MLTEKYVFRPAWVRTVGPGLALAMLLSAAIVLAANHGMILPDFALRLHLVPNTVLLAFCTRWWLQGSIVVTSNRVILQGWAKVVDGRGRTRLAYIRQSVPRCEWHSLAVTGRFFATLVHCHEGRVIVFEWLDRPDMLRKLLAMPATPFDDLLTLEPLPLTLIALARALKLAVGGLSRWIVRLCPQASPHVNAAAAWALRQARSAIRSLGVHLVALSGESSSLALEYARFVAFCRHYVLGRRLTAVKGDLTAFYWRTLQEACVVYGQAPSTWILHPCVQSVEDVKQCIPLRAFERLWFDNLLQDVDSVPLGTGEPLRVPALVHCVR